MRTLSWRWRRPTRKWPVSELALRTWKGLKKRQLEGSSLSLRAATPGPWGECWLGLRQGRDEPAELLRAAQSAATGSGGWGSDRAISAAGASGPATHRGAQVAPGIGPGIGRGRHPAEA